MLIIKKRDKAEPATFPCNIQGKEVTLTVRPLDLDEIRKIVKKHTKYVVAVHPETKQAVRIPEQDNQSVGKDVIDYLLVGFDGFGSSDGQPMEVTLENKLMVASLKVEEGEDGPVYLSEIIQNKAKELSAAIEIEVKEQEKN
jgi:hypothetical protein